MSDALLRYAILLALLVGLLFSTSFARAQQLPSTGAVTSSSSPQGPRIELLVQKPIQLDGWRAQRRARFLTAIGSGLALSGTASLATFAIERPEGCRYEHVRAPVMAGIGTGIGLGLAIGGGFWLGHSRWRHGRQGPSPEQLAGVVALAVATAAVSTGVIFGFHGLDTMDGCI